MTISSSTGGEEALEEALEEELEEELEEAGALLLLDSAFFFGRPPL